MENGPKNELERMDGHTDMSESDRTFRSLFDTSPTHGRGGTSGSALSSLVDVFTPGQPRPSRSDRISLWWG